MTERDASDRLLRLNAALDGELDAMAQLALEREMRDDPALAAEYARLAALAPPPPPPAEIAAAAVPFRRRPWLDSRALAMAASFALLGFVLGAGLMSLRAPPSGGVSENLVSDFARAAIAGQPFDVASSDRHTVKPWLAGRTTVSAEIVDLAAQGFPLAGGRVAVVDRVPAPTLVYRHNEHLVAVTELPPGFKGARGGAGGIETIDGYHVARWRDANLAFVAVSDMDEQALGEFVAAFRRAAGAGTEPARR